MVLAKLDIRMVCCSIIVLVAVPGVSPVKLQITIQAMRADVLDGCNTTLVPVTKVNQTVLHVVEQINQKAPEEKQATWLALCHYNNLTTWQKCFRPPVPIWWGCYDIKSVNNRMEQLALASAITQQLATKRVENEAKTCGGKVKWNGSAAGPHVQLCNHVRVQHGDIANEWSPHQRRSTFTTRWSTSRPRASSTARSAGAAAAPTCSSSRHRYSHVMRCAASTQRR